MAGAGVGSNAPARLRSFRGNHLVARPSVQTPTLNPLNNPRLKVEGCSVDGAPRTRLRRGRVKRRLLRRCFSDAWRKAARNSKLRDQVIGHGLARFRPETENVVEIRVLQRDLLGGMRFVMGGLEERHWRLGNADIKDSDIGGLLLLVIG